MKKSDFYFDLPERLIAQHPLEQRDSSRMLVMDRKTAPCPTGIFTTSSSMSSRATAW